MNPYDEKLLADAVNNVAPKLVDGGKKFRGPNATYDFIYQVWVEKAILQTRHLPAMLETERANYLKQMKMLEEISHKGKYTDSYGWSPSREYQFTFSLTGPTYQYFANVVGPLLGYDKTLWTNSDSRIWKRIKAMIISGDKVRISKFAMDIEKKLMKERGKRIMGVINGTKGEGVGSRSSEGQDNIQQSVCDGGVREDTRPLSEPTHRDERDGLGTDDKGSEGRIHTVEDIGGTRPRDDAHRTLPQEGGDDPTQRSDNGESK